jgi:hypothetical protein
VYLKIILNKSQTNKQKNRPFGRFFCHRNPLPEIGQKIQIDDYVLEVIDKDGQRIDKIMITKK